MFAKQSIEAVSQAMTLKAFYDYLKHARSANDETVNKFLLAILARKDDLEFIKKLNEHELDALTNGEVDGSLTYLLFDKMKPSQPTRGKKTTEDSFQAYLSLLKQFLPLFTKEVLDSPCRKGIFVTFFGEYTALSLAISYLCELRRERIEITDYEKDAAYQKMAVQWKKEIIDPLLALGLNPDNGYAQKGSLLMACILLSLPSPEDPFYQLSYELLPRVHNIDKRFRYGPTAFALAALGNFPEDFLTEMLAKGANINVLFRDGMFPHVEAPLLNFMIKLRRHDWMKFLLAHGADPNLMPTMAAGSHVSLLDQDKTAVLTPFQLAVSMDDRDAILILREHCEAQKISVNAESHAFEKKRTLKNHYKFQGSGLFFEVKNNEFTSKQKMLSDLKEKFNLRCYVKNSADELPIRTAITWLFEQAPKSSAAHFWRPALGALRQEMQSSTSFGIYVNEAPDQYRKINQPESSTDCKGVYHGNITVQSNLNTKDYVRTIAHEVGHLLDVKLGTLSERSDARCEQLKLAMKHDLANIKSQNINLFSDDAEIDVFTDNISLYSETQKTKEYFTRVLFEIPIYYAHRYPEMSEEALMTKMRKYFPQTMIWFQQTFPSTETTQQSTAALFK